LKLFGPSYVDVMWLRTDLKRRARRTPTLLAPFSQVDRSLDSVLKDPALEFLKAFRETPRKTPWYANGCNYEGADFAIYLYMLERFRPRRIVEIGSGGSTQLAWWWGVKRKRHVDITSIDPAPRTVIPDMTRWIATRVEDARIELFEELERDDILFIDSSHTTSEALYHVESILPRLKAGVVVHHHDIYYPYDVHSDFGEQRVVLDYYAGHPEWKILAPSAFTYWWDHWLYRAELRVSATLAPSVIPSSFWTVRQ
jgi:hypothetical protein